MKRSIHLIASSLVAAFMLAVGTPAADAGRVGGPMNVVASVPTATSVFYSIPFAAGAPAMVTVTGDNQSILFVFLYDSDGHVTSANASFGGSGTVAMNVYRAGNFRVEVRSMGLRPCNFRLTTN